MLEPVNFPNAILVEACDIPADMTIAEWRRARAAVRTSRRVGIVRRLLRRDDPRARVIAATAV
jgi:hypothetical protein